MNMKNKSIGTLSRQKLAKVLALAKGIVVPALVAKCLDVSIQEAGRMLSRWCRQGWVKRIKTGVYIPISVEDLTGVLSIEDDWVLADRLFSVGYIAGFSAVKYWDFSDQLFETTTFFTIKKLKNRLLLIGNTRFYLKTIVDHKFFGTKPVWRNNSKILVSDPTKTIVDLLDDPTIVGGMRVVQDIFLAYKASPFFDVSLLIIYAEKMKNKTIFKRLGFLMETLHLFDMISECHLRDKISKGYSLFDPSIKNVAIVRRWNLKVPISWRKKND
jgi:predicted transcriptional regulator of viral defense system